MTQEFSRISWTTEVLRRLGKAAPETSDSHRMIERFLARTFIRHFEDPPNVVVQPPLPMIKPIPLDSWVALRLIPDRRQQMQGTSTSSSPVSPQGTLSVERILQSTDPCVIIGDPGAGKSTLVRWAARYMMREHRLAGIVPIVLPMSLLAPWWAANDSRTPFHFYWEEVLRLPKAEAGNFNDFMVEIEGGEFSQRQLFRVFLDGFDEIPPNLRRETLRRMLRFDYSFPTILTSRPPGDLTLLPSWPIHEISKLTFGGMRELIYKVFASMQSPWLTRETCERLDRHPTLRDFGRNPFVLTLICSIADQAGGVLPSSLTSLYDAAVELMRQHGDRPEGLAADITFAKPDLARTQEVAFELLCRKDGSPYVFRTDAPEIDAAGANDLPARWAKAKMVRTAEKDTASIRFVHATVHESLAAHGLLQRLQAGTLTLVGRAIGGPWLNCLRFVFGNSGSLGSQARAQLWEWLKAACDEPDAFGLVHVHAAHLVREAGDQAPWHNTKLHNSLWANFLRSPDPFPYASALVALDPDFVVRQVDELTSERRDLVLRIAVLYFLLPPESRSGARLFRAIGEGLVELPDLEDAIGYVPTEIGLLSQAEEPTNPLQVINEITEFERNGKLTRKQAQRLFGRLARTGSAEAEEFLASRLHDVEPYVVQAAASGLQRLGTLRARDALLERLAMPGTPDSLAVTFLNSVEGTFITAGAEAVLECLGASHTTELRLAAAAVLAHCDRGDILNKMADTARITEPDIEVRKAVIKALGDAGAFKLVSILLSERLEGRDDIDERRCIWDYCGAIARRVKINWDEGGQFRAALDILFNLELDKASVPSAALVRQAASLNGAVTVRNRVMAIFRSSSYPPAVRAAALLGLEAEDQLQLADEVKTVFASVADDPEQRELGDACAAVIAKIAPAELLQYKNSPSASSALWQMSLSTGALVYGSRIEVPGELFTSVSAAPTASSSLPRRRVVVILATGWGPMFGGINSFNQDFCLAIGELIGRVDRVICLTSPCGDDQRMAAELMGVELITLTKFDLVASDKTVALSESVLRANGVDRIDLLIGHDVKTGPLAFALRERFGGSVAVFHHMSYGSFRAIKRTGVDAIHSEQEQSKLFSRADLVLSVGPTLDRSARELVQGTVPVKMIVPGLAKIDVSDFREGYFRAIAFGRLGGDDDRIKQGTLAATAFGRFVSRRADLPRYRDFRLNMYGLSSDRYNEEQQRLREIVCREASRVVNVVPSPYLEDREVLFGALRRNEVAMMLSLHEGFGLVGWEAIAAGVPLVLSKHSGLFELLEKESSALIHGVDVRGGDGDLPSELDIACVSDALFRIATDLDGALTRAKELRGSLLKKYTWKNCAQAVLDAAKW
ncbi:MAG: hypothetical protein QM754_07910 [Tepidisphaeraceae bacterium]